MVYKDFNLGFSNHLVLTDQGLHSLNDQTDFVRSELGGLLDEGRLFILQHLKNAFLFQRFEETLEFLPERLEGRGVFQSIQLLQFVEKHLVAVDLGAFWELLVCQRNLGIP